ncbi:MAG: DEAD/DEAH box helicase family protein [Nanoarchaeota archaeon]|nr:DEAD/DEAH box helicase family protein [Nanoarchaeota archaeon]
MSFKDLSLSISYRTKKSNPIEQFFEPVLSKSISYNVAVGYFSSAWIRDNSFGIAKFAANGGKAKWIVSPFDLSPEDRIIFIKAYEKSSLDGQSQVNKKVIRSFDELFDQLQNDARIALAWLIQDGIIEFKMGIPYVSQGEGTGILHSKMGYFKDADGNELSFSGSYNLTGQARFNWERFDVFKSWDSPVDASRTREIRDDLETMWSGDDDTLMVFEPSEEALEKFKNLTKTTHRPYKLPQTMNKTLEKNNVQIPSYFLGEDERLRDYQEKAISGWFENNGRGIFHMATGSGKTATALSAMTRLYNLIVKNKDKPLVIIISVPFVSLAKQWVSEAAAFGFEAISCFGTRDDWMESFQTQLQSLKSNRKGCLFIIAVNRSLTGPTMQSLLSSIKCDFLFVGDEMHNLGAQINLNSLPQNANFRIGLSATPDREYDEEGTKNLEKYFGKEVIEFTINDAIERGYLCKYFYYPILVEMTDDEWSEYVEITNQISRIYSREKSDGNGQSPYLQNLIFKRARLVGKAENKQKALLNILDEKYRNSTHMIIYCGDAKDGDERQVDLVTKSIVTKLNMRVNKFTSDEAEKERDIILSNFKEGNTQALVAIKCLDEGIDIPKTDTAFILASSTTKRQFIQRRGRVLRKASGKQYAHLYDFIALPRFEASDYDSPEALKIERQLFSKELERINEFSIHALNSGDTLELLRSTKQRLNLMHM